MAVPPLPTANQNPQNPMSLPSEIDAPASPDPIASGGIPPGPEQQETGTHIADSETNPPPAPESDDSQANLTVAVE